jgi:uncharacterized membrane protein
MFYSKQSGFSDEAASGLAYVTFIPALVFLIAPRYKNKPEVRFHSWQSALFWLSGLLMWVILSVIGNFPPLAGFMMISINLLTILIVTSIVAFLFFILWLVATIQAFNGKRFKIAVIGNMAAKRANG